MGRSKPNKPSEDTARTARDNLAKRMYQQGMTRTFDEAQQRATDYAIKHDEKLNKKGR